MNKPKKKPITQDDPLPAARATAPKGSWFARHKILVAVIVIFMLAIAVVGIILVAGAGFLAWQFIRPPSGGDAVQNVKTISQAAPADAASAGYVNVGKLLENKAIQNMFDIPPEAEALAAAVKGITFVMSPNGEMVVIAEVVGVGLYGESIPSLLGSITGSDASNIKFTETTYAGEKIFVSDDMSYFVKGDFVYVGTLSSLHWLLDSEGSGAEKEYQAVLDKLPTGDLAFAHHVGEGDIENMGVSAVIGEENAEVTMVYEFADAVTASEMLAEMDGADSLGPGIDVTFAEADGEFVIITMDMDLSDPSGMGILGGVVGGGSTYTAPSSSGYTSSGGSGSYTQPAIPEAPVIEEVVVPAPPSADGDVDMYMINGIPYTEMRACCSGGPYNTALVKNNMEGMGGCNDAYYIPHLGFTTSDCPTQLDSVCDDGDDTEACCTKYCESKGKMYSYHDGNQCFCF